MEKLGLSYEMPDGSTFKFSGTDTEQAAAQKAMHKDAKDQKNLQEVGTGCPRSTAWVRMVRSPP